MFESYTFQKGLITITILTLFGLFLFQSSFVTHLMGNPLHKNETMHNFSQSTQQRHKEPLKQWCINHSHPFIQKLHAGEIQLSPGSRTLHMDLNGRLGNVMFQLAASYAIAKDTNAKLIVKDTPYLKFLQNFNHLDPKAFQRLKHSGKTLFMKGKYDEDFVKAVQHVVNESIILRHYLQKIIYFQGCANEIREKLQLRLAIIQYAKKTLINIAKLLNTTCEKSTFVGIHVRRGDRTSRRLLKLGFGVPGKSYFIKAMKYYTDKYKNVIFVVASDDRQWVRENLLGKNAYLSPLNTPADDMALVSACNHTIISIGTFSWWCGFLNMGETVYYKYWLIPGTKIYTKKKFQLRELYPPDWIPMLD